MLCLFSKNNGTPSRNKKRSVGLEDPFDNITVKIMHNLTPSLNLTRSLKVKANDTFGLPIYDLVSVFSTGVVTFVWTLLLSDVERLGHDLELVTQAQMSNIILTHLTRLPISV